MKRTPLHYSCYETLSFWNELESKQTVTRRDDDKSVLFRDDIAKRKVSNSVFTSVICCVGHLLRGALRNGNSDRNDFFHSQCKFSGTCIHIQGISNNSLALPTLLRARFFDYLVALPSNQKSERVKGSATSD